jgi:hypothetical protein
MEDQLAAMHFHICMLPTPKESRAHTEAQEEDRFLISIRCGN